MSYQRTEIPESDIQHQLDICAQLRAHFTAGGRQPLAMVDTYGCQQNEADSEKLRGYLRAMGFDFTQDEFAADVVVMNTCAVREHAETRVFGNVGALTHTKARNPNQIIAVCGCMAQQAHVAEKLKKSYRIVDLVFGPHELWRFPELLRTVCTEHRRVFAIAPADGSVAEGIPQQRDGSVKAWLSIMYGCNNFCTYCIVPYVRGRERSRHPDEIEREARELVAAGYKDITLLGQNVDSYGRDLDEDVDFADLIRRHQRHPGRLCHPLHEQPPEGRDGKALSRHGRVRKVRAPDAPARAERQRPRPARDEPRLHAREISGAGGARAAVYARSCAHDGHHRGLSPARRTPSFRTRSRSSRPCATTRCSPSSTRRASARRRRRCPTPTPARRSRCALTRSSRRPTASRRKSTAPMRAACSACSSTGPMAGATIRSRRARRAAASCICAGTQSLVGRFVDVKITGSNTWALYGEEV